MRVKVEQQERERRKTERGLQSSGLLSKRLQCTELDQVEAWDHEFLMGAPQWVTGVMPFGSSALSQDMELDPFAGHGTVY